MVCSNFLTMISFWIIKCGHSLYLYVYRHSLSAAFRTLCICSVEHDAFFVTDFSHSLFPLPFVCINLCLYSVLLMSFPVSFLSKYISFSSDFLFLFTQSQLVRKGSIITLSSLPKYPLIPYLIKQDDRKGGGSKRVGLERREVDGKAKGESERSSDILMQTNGINLERATALQMIYAEFTGTCLKAHTHTHTSFSESLWSITQ